MCSAALLRVVQGPSMAVGESFQPQLQQRQQDQEFGTIYHSNIYPHTRPIANHSTRTSETSSRHEDTNFVNASRLANTRCRQSSVLVLVHPTRLLQAFRRPAPKPRTNW
jgi:hypothetical protein